MLSYNDIDPLLTTVLYDRLIARTLIQLTTLSASHGKLRRGVLMGVGDAVWIYSLS